VKCCGQTFLRFAILHRAESRGFTIRGKSRSSHATSPWFARPGDQLGASYRSYESRIHRERVSFAYLAVQIPGNL
jgi:hypothetical protein